MSYLDRKDLLSADLMTRSISKEGSIKYYNSDKNVANIYMKLMAESSDGVQKEVAVDEASNYTVKIDVIKPKTNQIRTVPGVLSTDLTDETCAIWKFELGEDFTNQIGEVICQTYIKNTTQNLTMKYFAYTVEADKLTGLNAEIVTDPDLPILKELIQEVKKTAQTVNNIDDVNITDTKTFSNKKIKEQFDGVDAQFNTIEQEKLDKNSVLSMSNMGQDVKEAMTGGSVAVVGENAILEKNIVDKQVTLKKLDNVLQESVSLLGVQKITWETGKRDGGDKINDDKWCIMSNKIYFNVGDTIEFLTSSIAFKFCYWGLDGDAYDSVKSSTSTWIKQTYTIQNEGYHRISFSFNPTSTTIITEDNLQSLLNCFNIKPSKVLGVDGGVIKNNSIQEEKLSKELQAILLKKINSYSQNNIKGFGFTYSIVGSTTKGIDIKDNFICLGDPYNPTTSDTPSKHTIYGREFPIAKNPSYLSDICVVDDELWVFSTGIDDRSEYSTVWRFKYDPSTNEFLEEPKFFWCDWGHVNALNYNSITDSIITGNGSADYNLSNKIYIISNIKSIKNSNNGDIFKLSEYGIEIDCSDRTEFGKKLNVVWNNGSGNSYNYAKTSEYIPNMAYAYSDDVNKIHIIVLGYGTNQYQHGNYMEPTQNCIWNGTYNILYSYQIGDSGEVIGNPGSYSHCGQGADSINGKLYIGLGHSEFWFTEISPSSYDKCDKKDTWIPQINHETGNFKKTTTRGLAITRDYTIVALNSNIYYIPR